MTREPLVPASQAPLAPPWSVDQWFGAAPDFGLHALRGQVVALHTFQMLCPGCVTHGLPQAQRIRATFSGEDVAVVGLHTVFEHHDAMRPVSLAAFLHEYRIHFPVGVDSPSDPGPVPQTMARYGLRGTPSLVLIDRQGRLRFHAFGRPEDMLVGAAIAALLAEPALGADAGPDLASADAPHAAPGCDDDGCAL
ncbi:MAG: TlpA disulfide reductase family protein [Myxococcota bacterium]